MDYGRVLLAALLTALAAGFGSCPSSHQFPYQLGTKCCSKAPRSGFGGLFQNDVFGVDSALCWGEGVPCGVADCHDWCNNPFFEWQSADYHPGTEVMYQGLKRTAKGFAQVSNNPNDANYWGTGGPWQPCANGGTCTNGLGRPNCQCGAAYRGTGCRLAECGTSGTASGSMELLGTSFLHIESGIALNSRDYSMCSWLHRFELGREDHFFGVGDTSDSYNNLFIGFRETNQFTNAFGNADHTTADTFTDTSAWHHWCVVYHVSGQNSEIWRDGDLVDYTSMTTVFQGSGPAFVGRMWDGSLNTNRGFRGRMAEFKVWSSTLDSGEIANLAQLQEGVSVRPADLLVYYNFKAETGDVTDRSGKNRHGTPYMGHQLPCLTQDLLNEFGPCFASDPCSSNPCETTCQPNGADFTCSPCPDGYSGSGKWSEGGCIQVTCDTSPPAPADGSTTTACPTPANHGATCQFACNSGFVLSGVPSVTCDTMGYVATGQWNPVGSTLCTRAQCGAFTPVNSGTVNCSGTAYEDTCELTCWEGYESVGGSLWTCTQQADPSTVDWEPPTASQCNRIVCPVLTPPDPPMRLGCSDGNNYASSCTYTCDQGWNTNPSNPPARVCQTSKLWSNSAPQCEVVTCPALDQPHLVPSCGGGADGSWTYAETCALSCQDGFRLTEHAEVTVCGEDGIWSGGTNLPVCASTACASPALPNTEYSCVKGDWSEGDVCDVWCSTGFHPGSTERTCGAGNVWYGDALTCEDLNECTDVVDACYPGTTCTNTPPGSYTCSPCPPGFSGDPKDTCVDVDECVLHPDWCVGECLNLLGSYVCLPFLDPARGLASIDAQSEVASPILIHLLDTTGAQDGELGIPILSGVVSAPPSGYVPPAALSAADWVVAYGDSSNPTEYTCQGDQATLVAMLETNDFACKWAKGAGTNFSASIVATDGGTGVTVSSTGTLLNDHTFGFKAPEITGLAPGKVVTTERMRLDGFYFLEGGDVTKMSATYGNVAPWDEYVCTLLGSTTSTETYCVTESPATSGTDYRFVVTVGGQVSAPSLVFELEVAQPPPIVTAVTSAAGVQVGNRSTSLPTRGQVTLTIHGANLHDVARDTLVLVDGKTCFLTVSGTTPECELPPGTGQFPSLFVFTGNGGSWSSTSTPSLAPYVSYALPTVTTISNNCTSAGCSRLGGHLLVLEGLNFGAMGATIFLTSGERGEADLTLCPLVKHTTKHTELSCVLPAGTGRVFVMMSQFRGTVVPTGQFIDYQKCPAGSEPVGYACAECVAGTFSDTPNSACRPCALGTFANSSSLPACTICPAGHWAPPVASSAIGSSSCIPCAAGSYNLVAARSSCEACASGSFAPLGGRSTRCELCDAGRSAGPGALTCSNCTAGWFSAQTGSVSCVRCAQGHWSPQGSSKCTQCVPGSYASLPASAGCLPCQQGKSQNEYAQDRCLTCGQGKFAGNVSQVQCEVCPAGTSPNVAHTACDPCQPGEFARQGEDTCEACRPGQFSSQERAEECVVCQPGHAQPNSGEAACERCAPGSYQNTFGQMQCLPCPLGFYSSAYNATVCTPCPAGQFQNEPGQPGCLPCPKGTFSAGAGRAQCSLCDAGFYSNTSNSIACDPCQVGRFSPPVDSQSLLDGIVECIPCPQGTHAQTKQQQQCQQCPLGKFSDAEGAGQCALCPPGRHSDVLGAPVCEVCDFGYFSEFDGSIDCGLCVAGRFSNVTEAGSCVKCAVGSFAPAPGRTRCELCPLGTFSNIEAAGGCSLCQPGQYINTTGNRRCRPCEPGRFQNEAKGTECLPCRNGTATQSQGQEVCLPCEPGRHAPAPGQQTCQECEPGKAQALQGMAQCDACAIGTFSALPNQAYCPPCALGSVADTPGQTNCSNCPPGSYQATDTDQFCTPCALGRFTSTASSASCAPCSPKTIAPLLGSESCIFCAQGTANQERTRCLCAVGLFAEKTPNSDVQVVCTTCPKGAMCQHPGVDLSSMETLQGWWRADGVDNQLEFYPCLAKTHCQGGLNSTCGPYRMGPICALCRDGFHASTSSGICEPCLTKTVAWVLIAGFVLLILLALGVMYYVVLRGDRELYLETFSASGSRLTRGSSIFREERAETRGAAPLSPSQTKTASLNFTTDEDFDTSQPSLWSTTNHAKYKSGAKHSFDFVFKPSSRRHPNVTYSMKIVLSFFQIVTALAFVHNVAWPSGFVVFISAFDFVNFDFIPWNTVTCVMKFDYFDRMSITALVPVVLLLLLSAIMFVGNRILDRWDVQDNDTMRIKRRKITLQYIKLCLFTIFITYPHICSTVLSMFVCRSVEGVLYMESDFNLVCFDDRYMQFLPVVSLAVLVYPVGIPVMFLVLLAKNRSTLSTPHARLSYGFLYDAFRRQCWWFEIADMIHKLMLTSVIKFVAPTERMQVGLVIVAMYTILILVGRPYISEGDDRLHLVAQTELLLLYMTGMILAFTEQGALDVLTDVVLSVVLVSTLLFLIIYFLTRAFNVCRKKVRGAQRQARGRLAKASIDESSLQSIAGKDTPPTDDPAPLALETD